jgi:transcriptional regulator with XRE-family HTH domain
VLLRRVIGDALRARRQSQHRTLREVSGAANVSLGYLSEIERGQKEASSELLAAICDALGAQLSEVLREVSDTFALAEQVNQAMAPAASPAVPSRSSRPAPAQPATVPAGSSAAEATRDATASVATRPEVYSVDGLTEESSGGPFRVTVRHETPLRTTLRARPVRRNDRGRDILYT